MLSPPRLSSFLISKQIQLAQEMLSETRKKLERAESEMSDAQKDEKAVIALKGFLSRADERRSVLFPFAGFREQYISDGFGGVQAEDLTEHEKYFQLVVSQARGQEAEVNRLKELIELLKKDINELEIASDVCFKNFWHYIGMKDLWWGMSALSSRSRLNLDRSTHTLRSW